MSVCLSVWLYGSLPVHLSICLFVFCLSAYVRVDIKISILWNRSLCSPINQMLTHIHTCWSSRMDLRMRAPVWSGAQLSTWVTSARAPRTESSFRCTIARTQYTPYPRYIWHGGWRMKRTWRTTQCYEPMTIMAARMKANTENRSLFPLTSIADKDGARKFVQGLTGLAQLRQDNGLGGEGRDMENAGWLAQLEGGVVLCNS